MQGQCVIFHRFGNPQEVLQVEQKDAETPRNHEVLVRMLARPVNPSDLIPIRGAYSHRIPLPSIPGYEGIGTVVDVGSSADQALIGKRVLPLRGEGTWQQYVKTSKSFAVQIPDSIDDFTAAQLYINPLTAWVVCTEILGLGHSDTMIMNGCSSALGLIFAQLSKVFGFRFIAVIRNDQLKNKLLHLGASDVIHTMDTSLYEAVMDLTSGKGADTAIDIVGGTDGNELARCIKPHGQYLSLGLLSGVAVNWKEIAEKANVHPRLFHLRHWNERVSVETWHQTFQSIVTFVEQGRLRLEAPSMYYSLAEVREAVRMSETSERGKGKVFLYETGCST